MQYSNKISPFRKIIYSSVPVLGLALCACSAASSTSTPPSSSPPPSAPPASSPPASSAPTSSAPTSALPPSSASTPADASAAFYLGTTNHDIEVGVASPTESESAWVSDLGNMNLGTFLEWQSISSLAAPHSLGPVDKSLDMGEVCDLTDGTQELYVEDGGNRNLGNELCMEEEQNGWNHEASPGPIAEAQQS